MKFRAWIVSGLVVQSFLSIAFGADLDPSWLGQVLDSAKPGSLAASVQANGLKDGTRNPDVLQLLKNRPGYTHEIPTGAVMDQGYTGNCWIEGGLNVVRSRLFVERGLDTSFNFSTNYLFFYSLVEKANVFLDGVVQSKLNQASASLQSQPQSRSLLAKSRPSAIFQDGGFWETFTYLVGKYGMVPSDVMPATAALTDDSTMLQEMDNVLAVSAEQILRSPSTSAEVLEMIKLRGIATVLRVLQTYLGHPPKSFAYAGVNYTPLSFNQNFVKLDFSQYAHVGAYPNLTTNQHYVFHKTEVSSSASGRRMSDVDFLNVTNARMGQLIQASIMKDQPVWTQIDSAIDLDSATGILHPQIYRRAEAYGMSETRFMPNIVTGLSLRAMGANHAPAIVGVDVDVATGKVIKFKIENSWGASSGDKGFLHMYNEWFQLHDYEAIVPKNLLSDSERALLATPAQAAAPMYNFGKFLYPTH